MKLQNHFLISFFHETKLVKEYAYANHNQRGQIVPLTELLAHTALGSFLRI